MKLVNKKRKSEVIKRKVVSNEKQRIVKVERHTPLRVPKVFRRLERTRHNVGMNLNNDGSTKSAKVHTIGGGTFWNPQAIYISPRKKFKGWQRENRRHRKTA